ncbi:MAG TPA: DUF5317 domain-containing protein [Mycobacteriales bacterium]|nr:DUF5317 domain-containing protein [Mycobacteriales bacterium]
MLLIAATLLAVLLVPLLGGRLRALAGLQLRGAGLLVTAFAVQFLALMVLPADLRPLLVALHGLSYVLAGCFVWCNRRVPGLLVLAAGASLNALGLAVNGGTLPASASALRQAGMPAVAPGYSNSSLLADPHLAWLGDVFASPGWLPLQNVYSIGDVLILSGAVWCIHRTCGTVLARLPRRHPAAGQPAVGQPVAAGARASSQPGRASAGIGRLSR